MKRFFVYLITIAICGSAFTKNQEPMAQASAKEMLLKAYMQLDTASKMFDTVSIKLKEEDFTLQTQNAVQEIFTKSKKTIAETGQKISIIKDGISALEQENTQLKSELDRVSNENKHVGQLLTSYESCKMFIEYPLANPYDSVLVKQALEIIRIFEIDKGEKNKNYCKLLLPYLENYGEYNEEMYKLFGMIKDNYLGVIKRTYSLDLFTRDIKKTKYFQKCDKDGIEGIPFLEDKIKHVKELIITGQLSADNLQNIMNEMK